MDKQERLMKLKEAQEKITNEIEELKNEIENEKPKCWKPVTGEKVWTWWYVANGPLSQVYLGAHDFHINKYEEGEYFPTKELCIEHHKEKIYKEQWRRLSIESGEDKNPWDGHHNHWYVWYDPRNSRLNIGALSYIKDANVHFVSYEAAENAIKEIGEENVKRYILGIKE